MKPRSVPYSIRDSAVSASRETQQPKLSYAACFFESRVRQIAPIGTRFRVARPTGAADGVRIRREIPTNPEMGRRSLDPPTPQEVN
jgi:hypothetical protein